MAAMNKEFECTYCHGTKFYEGPSGGGSVNVLCANPNCRRWFNWMGPLGMEDLDRIEPTDEEKEAERERIEKEAAEYPHHCYNEGEAVCRQGTSLTDLFESKPGWHQVTGADLWRLAGYVEELRRRLKIS